MRSHGYSSCIGCPIRDLFALDCMANDGAKSQHRIESVAENHFCRLQKRNALPHIVLPPRNDWICSPTAEHHVSIRETLGIR